MAKLKGMKKLNKTISAELKPFGISKAVCSDEYSYNFVDESVNFKLTENEIEDRWFTEFIKERFNYNVRYPFVMSLLHEIGHHKANDEITDAIQDFCENEKERITAEMFNADSEYSKKLEWQYFNLPDEIMATQWAVTYAIKHPKKIKKMWVKMKEALINFYKINGVMDEIEND